MPVVRGDGHAEPGWREYRTKLSSTVGQIKQTPRSGAAAIFALQNLLIHQLGSEVFSSGRLSLGLDLAPGLHALPVGLSEPLRLRIPDEGARLTMSLGVLRSHDGPYFGRIDLDFDRPLSVENLTVFTELPRGLLTSVVDNLGSAHVRGVHIDPHGKAMIEGELSAFNIPVLDLKTLGHLFAPKVNMSAKAMLAGDLLATSVPLLAFPDPSNLSINDMVAGLGGLTGDAHFKIEASGHGGCFQLASELMQLRGKTKSIDSHVTLEGDMTFEPDGRFSTSAKGLINTNVIDADIALNAEGQVSNGITGQLQTQITARPEKGKTLEVGVAISDDLLEGPIEINLKRGNLGAKIGDLLEIGSDNGIKIEAGRTWLTLVKAIGALNLDMGNRATLQLNESARLSINSDVGFALSPRGHFKINTPHTSVSLKTPGSIKSPRCDFSLDGQTTVDITGVGIDGRGQLHLEDVKGKSDIVVPRGYLRRGLTSFSIDEKRPTKITTSFDVDLTPTGPCAKANVSAQIGAQPRWFPLVNGQLLLNMDTSASTGTGMAFNGGRLSLNLYRRNSS